MSRCSEDNTFSNKVYRRFYSIGNNYSEDESKENLKNWNNYKAGIVMLSPVQLRSNFLKIEKIFNYHILKQADFTQEITVCPLCGGVNIRKIGENNYTCFDCSHNISITFCNDCDPEHKKPIIWAKYLDDRFLKNDDIVNDLLNLSVYNKLSKIENIMGEKATTGFELEHENNTWKLKTICPYCGIKLGDNQSK